MLAGKTYRSNPAVHAGEGDERIRTAVCCLSTLSAYVLRCTDRTRRARLDPLAWIAVVVGVLAVLLLLPEIV